MTKVLPPPLRLEACILQDSVIESAESRVLLAWTWMVSVAKLLKLLLDVLDSFICLHWCHCRVLAWTRRDLTRRWPTELRLSWRQACAWELELHH